MYGWRGGKKYRTYEGGLQKNKIISLYKCLGPLMFMVVRLQSNYYHAVAISLQPEMLHLLSVQLNVVNCAVKNQAVNLTVLLADQHYKYFCAGLWEDNQEFIIMFKDVIS